MKPKEEKQSLMEQLVPLTSEQLSLLQKIYPDRAPSDPSTAPSQVWFDAGKASVIRSLVAHSKKHSNIGAPT